MVLPLTRGKHQRILRLQFVITGRNEVLAKVIFLHLSVILFTGGCLLQIFGGVSAPNFQEGCLLQIFGGCLLQSSGGMCAPNFRGEGCLLQIWGGVCSKFFWGGSSNFQNTVNIRPVRILLECILVLICEMWEDLEWYNDIHHSRCHSHSAQQFQLFCVFRFEISNFPHQTH